MPSPSSSPPLDLSGIDLGISVSPKKWTNDQLKYMFSANSMKYYIDRMNGYVLEEMSKGHIKYTSYVITINNKKAFDAEYYYEPVSSSLSQFFSLYIRTPSVYMDKINVRWWINKNEYSLTLDAYGKNKSDMNETTLAYFLLLMCVYRQFDGIPNVDLTFRNTLEVPDFMIRFDYLTPSMTSVNKNIMVKLTPYINKFKEYITQTLPPPAHEEQLTEYKINVGDILVKMISDAFPPPSSSRRSSQVGGKGRKGKNEKKLSKPKAK